ncbi:MAG TPA: YqjK family protein [Burkholderiales bacterium]|nr:YqjK family protein [Burkholderiales bacterium]
MRVQELVARSSAQRDAIIASARPLLQTVEAPDRILGFVRRHPLPLAMGVLALVLLGPRKAVTTASRALSLFALLRTLRD